MPIAAPARAIDAVSRRSRWRTGCDRASQRKASGSGRFRLASGSVNRAFRIQDLELVDQNRASWNQFARWLKLLGALVSLGGD